MDFYSVASSWPFIHGQINWMIMLIYFVMRVVE